MGAHRVSFRNLLLLGVGGGELLRFGVGEMRGL